MKLTLESTEKTVLVNGIQMRLWEGASASGIPCIAIIARIAVPENVAGQEAFMRELRECKKPATNLAGDPCWNVALTLPDPTGDLTEEEIAALERVE